jgi:Tfp pilus assembly protein PilF
MMKKMLFPVLLAFVLGAAMPALALSGGDKPSTAPEYLVLAKQAMEAKDFTKAQKLLNKAKKLDPEMPEVYRLLGDFHASFNRQWKADKFYQKAKELERTQAASEKGKKN